MPGREERKKEKERRESLTSRLTGFKTSLRGGFFDKDKDKDQGAAAAAAQRQQDGKDQRLLAFASQFTVDVGFKVVGFTARSFVGTAAHHHATTRCWCAPPFSEPRNSPR